MKPKLIRTLMATVVFSIMFGCDSNEQNDPSDEPNNGYDLDAVFSSKVDFEHALNKSGTATGTGYSGQYTVIFHGSRFSSDCTPEFARRNDFYVNDSASDATLYQRFSEIGPDYQVMVSIVQAGGRLTLNADGDGPESPLSGWIDGDGSFQALIGQYDDNRNHWVAGYAGRIEGDRMEGVFASRIKLLDDANVPGSCQWSADIVPVE